MKKLFGYLAILVLAGGLLSCQKNDLSQPVPEYLEVTANNIAGSWKLSEWNGGPLAAGSYFYIDFVRRDTKYTSYDNLSSFSVRKDSGRFVISGEEGVGAVIRGIADNSMSQEWNHRYIVTELSADRMVWTVYDNPEDVSVFVRCEIPEELL